MKLFQNGTTPYLLLNCEVILSPVLRGITPKTQRDYLREVGNLARYFGKSPEELGENEIKEYLLYLIDIFLFKYAKYSVLEHLLKASRIPSGHNQGFTISSYSALK